MGRNVVIFGPIDGGKSTLAGYLIAKCPDEGFDFERENSSNKRKLGDVYDEGQKFAYLTDTTQIERIRRKEKETQSTTKYTRPNPIKLDDQDISIIDTPGSKIDISNLPELETRKTNRQQIKGFHLGDSGIFMVEISKIVKQDLLDWDIVYKFFTPLFLWCKFRKTRKFVIVLSKIDKYNFSESKFNKAVELINTVLNQLMTQETTIDIIPISIDVKAEVDENVLTKSKKMSWYRGPTFRDRLKKICEDIPEETVYKPFFYCVDKYFEEGGYWRGKNLQGSLKRESLIKMSPVQYKKIGYVSVIAKIRNIRKANDEDTEIAESNSIVGLDLEDFRINDRHIQKENIVTLRTTCIVDINVPLFKGNILQFEIPLNKIDNFHMIESITIVWFGKYVTSYVVNKIKNKNNGLIVLELDNLMVSLPSDENGRFVYDKFLLKVKNIFIPANLKKIGIPKALNLIEYENTEKNKISDTFREFKYEILSNELKFSCDNSFKNLVEKIRDFYNVKDISSNIILETTDVIEK